MRRLFATLFALLTLVPCALADVRTDAPPEDWTSRDLLRVTFLNVGRSDAILLSCGGENLLIDGGSARYAASLSSALEAHGATEFKAFLNTHPHNDHIEGLIALMRRGYRPERFMSPIAAAYQDGSYHEEAFSVAWNAGIPFRLIRHGDTFPLGGATVTIWRSEKYNTANDRSAIQLITFGETRLLLLADLTGRAQKHLLSLLPEGSLQAEVIKAPHHGENAIVAEVLDAIAPSLVICTSGPNDAPALARQMHSRGLPLLYSGAGEIVLESDGTDWYAVQQTP